MSALHSAPLVRNLEGALDQVRAPIAVPLSLVMQLQRKIRRIGTVER
jgi:hypothetical protein